MRHQILRNSGLLLLVTLLAGCMSAGQTKEDKRRHVENMRKEVLTDLYSINPGAADEIKNAPGYAVFSNQDFTALWLGAGKGYGVVVDNASGAHTYMRMYAGQIGLGINYKDYRAVFIFEKRHMMEGFIEQGWTAGGQASASARLSSQGRAGAVQMLFDGIKVYVITETGLGAEATLPVSKYVKDSKLN